MTLTAESTTPSYVDTRQRILDVATKAFARSGYRGATVREIAFQARANLAAISYHFGSKEGLYAQVLQSTFGHLHAGADDTDERDWLTDPAIAKEQRLYRFVLSLLSPPGGEQTDGALHARLLAWEVVHPSGIMDAMARRHLTRELEAIGLLAAEFLPQKPDTLQLRLTAVWLLGQVMGFQQARSLALLSEADLPPDAALTARTLSGLILGGLTHPVSAF